MSPLIQGLNYRSACDSVHVLLLESAYDTIIQLEELFVLSLSSHEQIKMLSMLTLFLIISSFLSFVDCTGTLESNA